MTVQVVALAVIGFVPATVPHSYVTVPISFLAAVQIGLFRNNGDLNDMPVATTGNMMRLVEAGYQGYVDKNRDSRRAFGVYAAVIVTFTAGAVFSAIAGRAWNVHAIWCAAAILAETLVLFVIDGRAAR
jgi:uncharacterized membrane protein YoaK (UPF0700 family)